MPRLSHPLLILVVMAEHMNVTGNPSSSSSLAELVRGLQDRIDWYCDLADDGRLTVGEETDRLIGSLAAAHTEINQIFDMIGVQRS